ncbi:hypothetical protein RSOLAG22IIIB_07511 [Rhizoctonia solani]|uniref:DUF6532 domain-containing protein n=1 Tax=Rhizoctonia solani TaxID=456999 RepID=A0A0K6FNI4_9AGAM|nr:hypothetical protein RSOLAG22IIIB_07511 [Rhizoctonia solani]
MVVSGMYETDIDTVDQRRLEAWEIGLKKFNKTKERYPLSMAHIHCMNDCLLTWRSHAKSYVQGVAAAEYFPKNQEMTPAELEVHIKMLKASGLHTKPGSDPGHGSFQHSLIQTCMDEMLFRHKRDIGVQFADLFQEPTVQLICFFCAVLQSIVEEREDGKTGSGELDFEAQRKAYNTHLASHAVWLIKSEPRWKLIQKQLFVRTFKQSGAHESAIPTSEKSVFREEDLQPDDPNQAELEAWEWELAELKDRPRTAEQRWGGLSDGDMSDRDNRYNDNEQDRIMTMVEIATGTKTKTKTMGKVETMTVNKTKTVIWTAITTTTATATATTTKTATKTATATPTTTATTTVTPTTTIAVTMTATATGITTRTATAATAGTTTVITTSTKTRSMTVNRTVATTFVKAGMWIITSDAKDITTILMGCGIWGVVKLTKILTEQTKILTAMEIAIAIVSESTLKEAATILPEPPTLAQTLVIATNLKTMVSKKPTSATTVTGNSHPATNPLPSWFTLQIMLVAAIALKDSQEYGIIAIILVDLLALTVPFSTAIVGPSIIVLVVTMETTMILKGMPTRVQYGKTAASAGAPAPTIEHTRQEIKSNRIALPGPCAPTGHRSARRGRGVRSLGLHAPTRLSTHDWVYATSVRSNRPRALV